MVGSAKHIGRIGALAIAPGIRNVRRNATRVTVSIGIAAVVVAATVVPAPVSTVSPTVKLSADSTALILCGTTCPTPDDFWVEAVRNQFIAPTHPGLDIEYVAVTTPEESWPITGLLRLLGLAFGDPRLWGPGGPGWPDEPLWKLSGLFDLTLDQSLQAGVADLETAMAKHPNDHQVIFGDSQGAAVANEEKRRLAEQYPAGTKAPDIDFVLHSDPNLPNGGLAARFPGLYIPILDLTANGPAPTDTQFDTVEITRQYDGFADFPLYALNVISLLNAVLGILYVHMHPFDVSLPPDPTKTSPAFQDTHGDTSYYFFENPDLPLFGPLRTLGVPESLIDVVEPFFRVLVELGYDRSIPPWEPTPARLIPTLNPGKVAADLVNAIGEGINNAATLIGLPPLLSIPAPVTRAAPAIETAKANVSPLVTSSSTPTRTKQVTSTDTPTRTKQVSSAPAGVSESSTTATPEPSASASTPKTAKPAGRPKKPRPVVRDSLAVGRQLPDRSHRGEGDQPTTRTAAAGAGAATGARSSAASSSAASSSTGSSSRGASGGDGHGLR